MTNDKNPITLEWIAETFKAHLENRCVLDPEALMRGLLEARAAYEQALRVEGYRKVYIPRAPLSGGILECRLKTKG